MSPRHFSQNLSSEFESSSGFRPRREAPGISFSVRIVAFEEERRDALDLLTSFPCSSPQPPRVIRHYESRVQKVVYSFEFSPCLTLSGVYFLEWQFLILSSALLLFFSWLCGEFIFFFQWSKHHREPQDLFSSALPVTVGEF